MRVAFPDDHEGGEGQAETRLQLLGTSASIARALSAVEYLVYSELWPSPYLSDLERELLRNRTWVGFEEEQLVEKEGWWVLNQFSEDAWALVGRAAVRDEEAIRERERRRRGIYSELGTAAGEGREDDRFAPQGTQQRNWNERGGNRGEPRWAPQGRDDGWSVRENRDRWNAGDEPVRSSFSFCLSLPPLLASRVVAETPLPPVFRSDTAQSFNAAFPLHVPTLSATTTARRLLPLLATVPTATAALTVPARGRRRVRRVVPSTIATYRVETVTTSVALARLRTRRILRSVRRSLRGRERRTASSSSLLPSSFSVPPSS